MFWEVLPAILAALFMGGLEALICITIEKKDKNDRRRF